MRAIIPIPAFSDNYIWLIHDGRHAVLVDPGDATPAFAALAALRLELRAILLTHHHPDHVGGAAELAAATGAAVYGPSRTACGTTFHTLAGDERVVLGTPELALEVLAVPGHTRDHLAYYGIGALFCGDTLFAGGCGRLFEGSPAQMFSSLQRLARLPHDTLVFCAHEYTLANLRFACRVEPENAALAAREMAERAKRERALPTLPSTIGLERATNPFLRCQEPAVIAAAGTAAGQRLEEPVAVFTALRAWKDRFTE
ncbi:MAG: hydroxyacylglutathione hydrolase [Betaproteobacteria bacterium]|nr:hydroxyacylglutathione hydrolase [Betaproteobacteria bacterium]